MMDSQSSKLVYILLVLTTSSCHGAFDLPMFFSNGMVLQQAPQLAQVYGTTDDTDNPVTALINCVSGTTGQYEGLLVSILKKNYGMQRQ